MISINNLSVSFGGFSLFDNVNFHINQSDRIGLVGRNGSGKTTLLKIIAGEFAASDGSVQMPSDIKIGYLPQEMEISSSTSVLEETLKAFSDLIILKKKLASISNELESREDFESESYEQLLIKYNEATDHYNLISSIKPEAEAERVLIGLGFKREEFSRKRSELSQGWNMRIELAKVLLAKADILLLDEPTNHLDIESIRWLESYLSIYKGAVILISHDRKFLDTITTRTVEIVLGKINDYKVPYSLYTELRAERILQQKAAYDNQRKKIEKNEEFIERFRYKASKSNQVQSRVKQLDKLEIIEIEEEDNSSLHLRFPAAPRSGHVVVKARGVQISYGEKKVFENVDITIERGEKIALAGKNGEGKSTFIKIVAGELAPSRGTLVLGHNVVKGYFAQNQEDILDGNSTVFETLDKIAVGDIRTRLRDILGAFLFKGEDIEKRVRVLSGGEKSRLAMAKLILNPYNLLLLDEPTNHMDIRSKDILKQALKQYDGTLIIVSHDRDFLDGLADKIFEFKDGSVKEHLGGVKDFLERKNIDDFSQLNIRDHYVSDDSPVKESGQNYKKQKEQERENKRRNSKIEKSEREISLIEKRIAEIEEILSVNHNSLSLSESLKEYQECKDKLDTLMDEWEKLHTL